MQDRFKFRIWYGPEKVMMLFNNSTLLDGKVCSNDNGGLLFRNYDHNIKNVHECKPEDFVLMQCTGLKDKNGKLIFEGDILKVENGGYPKTSYINKVVIWDRKEWQLAQKNKEYKNCKSCANRNKSKCSYCKEYFMSTGHTNFKDFYYSEVIGNIYTNPELLPEEVQA